MRKFKNKYHTLGLFFSGYNFRDEEYFLKILDLVVSKCRRSKTRGDIDDMEIKRAALAGYQHSVIEDKKHPLLAATDELELIIKLFSGSNQEIESYNYKISWIISIDIFSHWPHERFRNVTDLYFEEALCHFIFTCHNPDDTSEPLSIDILESVVSIVNKTIESYYRENRDEDLKYGVINAFANALNKIYEHSVQQKVSVINEIVKFDSINLALRPSIGNRYYN